MINIWRWFLISERTFVPNAGKINSFLSWYWWWFNETNPYELKRISFYLTNQAWEYDEFSDEIWPRSCKLRTNWRFDRTYDRWASLVAQTVKNLPAVQETWVWSLGWEDPLEKEMATHCSIVVWEIPWTKEPGGLQTMGSQRIRYNWATQQQQPIVDNISFGIPSFPSG